MLENESGEGGIETRECMVYLVALLGKPLICCSNWKKKWRPDFIALLVVYSLYNLFFLQNYQYSFTGYKEKKCITNIFYQGRRICFETETEKPWETTIRLYVQFLYTKITILKTVNRSCFPNRTLSLLLPPVV